MNFLILSVNYGKTTTTWITFAIELLCIHSPAPPLPPATHPEKLQTETKQPLHIFFQLSHKKVKAIGCSGYCILSVDFITIQRDVALIRETKLNFNTGKTIPVK